MDIQKFGDCLQLALRTVYNRTPSCFEKRGEKPGNWTRSVIYRGEDPFIEHHGCDRFYWFSTEDLSKDVKVFLWYFVCMLVLIFFM